MAGVVAAVNPPDQHARSVAFSSDGGEDVGGVGRDGGTCPAGGKRIGTRAAADVGIAALSLPPPPPMQFRQLFPHARDAHLVLACSALPPEEGGVHDAGALPVSPQQRLGRGPAVDDADQAFLHGVGDVVRVYGQESSGGG
mmetsp:Transcript_17749/g.36376  ORF Transcript_17749/g.36376 Transcript_17749/m.36376 type:complete len:141 (+) Transcript_17749:290-712(+)